MNPTGSQDDSAIVVHSLEVVAEITQTSRHLVAVYCRHGLIAPLDEAEHGGWTFDDEAIRKLRRMEAMRSAFGVNLAGLHLIEDLQQEVETLQEELRFLRNRLH
ncbi:MAG: chaperone modulator CbpM [Verrucomicrobium sp.]|nr:chaperone modulator CbpM [Verrucomicrobium sp.]